MNARDLLNDANLRRMVIPPLVAGAILIIVLLLYKALWASNDFEPSPKIIPVSRGESFSQVAAEMEEKGILSEPLLFRLAGRLFGFADDIRVGKYRFESGISNLDILYAITEGTSTANPAVTIFEGLRTDHVARLLRREVGIDSARFMSLFLHPELIGLDNTDAQTLEGFLLPDTYNFYWQSDEKEIVEKMLAEFRGFFVDSLQIRTKQMRMSIRQMLTVASIIEGETSIDNERPIIAGLYYNRLRRGMRLEADPTIQYLIVDGPRRLRYSDLKIQSPYNTYENAGLPPGPINNPGRQSILAALYPAHHQYLYFVATGNGGHRFASSYEEHLRNVREYRRTRTGSHSR